MTRMFRLVGYCALLLMAACEPPPVTLTPDWFVDSADLLTAQEEIEMIATLSEFYEQTQVELAGITVENLAGQPIEGYTATLFEDWELGTLETNNGIMVLLAVEERQVHIARGMGMAWHLPQSRVDSIATLMAGGFAQENYAAGFRSGLAQLMETAGAVPWVVDYLSIEDILEDGEQAIGRIAALDTELTGFEDDHVVVSGPAGNRALLQMPVNVPPLAVDDLLGIHGRIISINPLEMQVLGLEVDEPLY